MAYCRPRRRLGVASCLKKSQKPLILMVYLALFHVADCYITV
jgi:hypothetical protein